MDKNKKRKFYLSLFSCLISDALDLMPDLTRKMIIRKKGKKAIIDDAITHYKRGNYQNYSPDPDDLGALASYIITKIYGVKFEDIIIPQSVYYEGFEESLHFNVKLLKGIKELRESNNLARDRYNLAINLLLGVWLVNLKNSGELMPFVPKEGVYLRDKDKRFYLYQEA